MSVDSTPTFEANSHGFKFRESGRLFANRMLVERLPEGMSIDGASFFGSRDFKLKTRGGFGGQPAERCTDIHN